MEKKRRSPKKERWLRGLGVTLALAFLVVIPGVLTPLLCPKYLTVSKEGSLTEEYYASVAKTRHDVLFIGDCEVFESFVPAILWEDYGISSFLRGGAQQLPWHSYYMLEDALRYETPRVVVFNVYALRYGEPQKEAYNRMALDGMEWSRVKLRAVLASMTEEEELWTYLFPFFRYHSRWSELTAEDLRYAWGEKPPVSDSGYLMQTGVAPADPQEQVPPEPLVDTTLPSRAMEHLDRMRELCAERGIELILVKAPTNFWRYHWYEEWEAQVTAYAERHGLTYYNLIPLSEEIGLDMATDTYDGGAHLNVYGAEKLTRYFGELLSRQHALPDRRGEADTAALWQERVEAYYARKAAMEIASPSK